VKYVNRLEADLCMFYRFIYFWLRLLSWVDICLFISFIIYFCKYFLMVLGMSGYGCYRSIQERLLYLYSSGFLILLS